MAEHIEVTPETQKAFDKLVDMRYEFKQEVDHPSHYTQGDIECIDAMKASMTPEEFRGYLKGNAFKYLWRYELKNKPLQDLEKCQWYLEHLISELREDG